MAQNLLRNGGFEADWGDERSHRCHIFPVDEGPYFADLGNIFVPPGWVAWFKHKGEDLAQPEGGDIGKSPDPHRVRSGERAYKLFTFHRKHDAGLYQQVNVAPGTKLRLTAYAHAWSNHKGEGFPHPSDGRWSEGVGYDERIILEGDEPLLNGDPQNDALGNFTFYVGIDPTGGTDPFADTVVWGRGAHIYNAYHEVPAVEAVAQADTVTVFLRSKTLWAFKHNDAYWDDVELVAEGEGPPPEAKLSHSPLQPKVGEAVTIEARSLTALTDVNMVVRQPSGAELPLGPVEVGRDGNWHTWTYISSPLGEVGTHTVTFSAAGGVEAASTFRAPHIVTPQRGLPREQYERTYVLLPQEADAAWALAVVDASWDQRRYTIGSSADDAGIGALDTRRVIAVNPGKWPSDLRAFFAEHYPGVEYISVEAETPSELKQKLKLL
ncbi:MAG: hypothetical protein ACE5OS_05255 [Anaerolineae bacterium]